MNTQEKVFQICRYEHTPQVKPNHDQDQMSGWDTNPNHLQK